MGSLARVRTLNGCSGGFSGAKTMAADVKAMPPDNMSFGCGASGYALASPEVISGTSVFRNDSAARLYAAYGLDETPSQHVAMLNSNFDDDTPVKSSPESYLH